MKTKVKLFGAVAVFAIALGVNASIGMTNDSGDVALSDLVNASKANAECAPYTFMDTVCMQLRYVSLILKKSSAILIQCKNLR